MKAILLATSRYGQNYFSNDKEAPYPGFNYNQIPDWNTLINILPLPGIGFYKGQFANDYFSFLKIVGMRYDNINSPYFDFKVIGISNIPSITLTDTLPANIRNLLFSSIDMNILTQFLHNIGITPPDDWLQLTRYNQNNNTVVEIVRENNVDIYNENFLNYIGEYYKRLSTTNLNNDKFEDITASLLKALGFNVTQKGHLVEAAKADGIASFEDSYALVYDCKNSNVFVLTEEFKRAIDRYLEDERLLLNNMNLFPIFISRGFRNQNIPNYHLFTIESLLYLFYKKLILGNKFSLRPLIMLLNNNHELTKERIDIEWPI
jgi:hypothetical protein